MNHLASWGWRDDMSVATPPTHAPGAVPARIIEEHRDGFRLITSSGPRRARISGRLFRTADATEERPTVGDWAWVEVLGDEHARIQGLLPRSTCLVRRAAGGATRPQVVAANVDTVFLVSSLNQDLEPRRIERYLAAIWDSGATPVLLLSKADLCADPEPVADQLAQVAMGVALHVVSAQEGLGVERVRAYLSPGTTVTFVGSSGVGKSTLINALAGEDLQLVREIRASDDRGMHTTTSRRLLRLASGALVVDTPGMRELGLWHANDGCEDAFPEIAEAARACRFSDCSHGGEPGCGVQAAIDSGELTPERLAAWHKLERELAFVRRRTDQQAARAAARTWRKVSRMQRRMVQDRKRRRGE